MRRDQGFTLLEVLVAFVIAAAALTALFSGGLGGLRATAVSARYGEGVSRAQSHLAAATTGSPLEPNDQQGDEGNGFHWRIRITVLAAGTPDPIAPRTPVLNLYAISAAVSWTEDRNTRTVQLDTQQVSPAPLPKP